MQAERSFGAGDVERIVVHASRTLVDDVGWKYVPLGLTSAQFSLAYCVATLPLDGEVFVDQFTEDKLTDPARMALVEKISVRHDPEITAKGSKFRQMVRFEVSFRDGGRMERTLETSNRKKKLATEAEVVEKFEKLETHVLPRSQVERLRDATLGLEKLQDAGQLANLMAGG